MSTTFARGDTPSRPLRVRPASLTLRGRCLLLVAGMPGAGKTTLLGGLDAGPDVALLDSDRTRAGLDPVLAAGVPYRLVRPLVHLLHRAHVGWAALAGPRCVVVHLPATSAGLRRVVRGLARITARAPHLLWLDVTAEEALRGQQARGRTIRAAAFARHVDAAESSLAAVRADENWASVTVLDRDAARRGLRLCTGPK